jgi:carboxypeptidase Taq
VILRFGLERALLSGDLDAADLPGAWRDGMKRLVGIEPPDDKDGCLQDIHWYDGAIGYFPTYTLGALAAAQLRAAMERDLPDLEDRLAAGGFEAPLAWVRERVHGRASVAGTDGILEAATGAPLSADAFLAHLDKRYLAN